MPILYNKAQRKNPSKPEDPAKWYPVVKTASMLREKEVARQIADETTLNPKEAEMALAQLQKVMIGVLLNGQSVQLGDWGSFYLTFNAEGSETEAEAGPSKINKVNIRFSVGKELKDALAKATFTAAASLSNK